MGHSMLIWCLSGSFECPKVQPDGLKWVYNQNSERFFILQAPDISTYHTLILKTLQYASEQIIVGVWCLKYQKIILNFDHKPSACTGGHSKLPPKHQINILCPISTRDNNRI